MAEQYYRRGLRKMTGRDSGEQHRVASTLELLFDLTFVVAFGVAGSQLAHGIAAGLGGGAILAFVFTMGAVIWAWVGYSWMASAFDTDDWLFRLLTMVQMAGVVVLAMGLPQLFESLEHGHLELRVMVVAYVVMRIAVVGQWWRVAHDSPTYRRSAQTIIITTSIAQVCWILIAFSNPQLPQVFIFIILTFALEFIGPVLAERKVRGNAIWGTPWHPHHIAERYSLLTIITIGESVTGTVAAAQAITTADGWSLESIVIIGAGTAMSLALWWCYFILPSGPMIAARRDRVWAWAYAHIILLGSVAAIGSGIHLVGYLYEEHSELSAATAVAGVAIPMFLCMTSMFFIHAWLVSSYTFDVAHIGIILLPLVAWWLAAVGVPVWICVLVILASPVLVAVSYETWQFRKISGSLENALKKAALLSSAQAAADLKEEGSESNAG